MRILITGYKGFVGSEIKKLHEDIGYEVVGLEADGSFAEWKSEMTQVLDGNLDAIIHAGAISNNQTYDPDIYLWNSYATFLIARIASNLKRMPFVFISTSLVEETSNRWEERSPYCWSKVQCEDFINAYLPHATILRPAVVWGDERVKKTSSGSVPFQLANHSLDYLFENYSRRYVHVSDMAEAVNICLENKYDGTYSVASTEFWDNKDLANLIEWDDYEIVGDPREVGFPHIISHTEEIVAPLVEGWNPKIQIEHELPRLEKALFD